MTYRELFSFLLVFFFVLFITMLFFYSLTALSNQKIFKAYGHPHPGYAWIPFYRLYILADLTCGPIFKFGEFEIEKKYFLWWWVISEAIAFIPFIGSFLSIIIHIVCLGYCHHEGIKKLDSSYDSSVLSYISSIFAFFLWFLVLPKKVN